MFYAVDTGLFIGFGAVAEQKTLTKVFTLCHVMLGATVMVGLLALFAEAVVSDAGSVANAEFALAKLLPPFAATMPMATTTCMRPT